MNLKVKALYLEIHQLKRAQVWEYVLQHSHARLTGLFNENLRIIA